MSDQSMPGGERIFEGGLYDGREGIEVRATSPGLVISGWYDGAALLEVTGLLSWADIEAMKATVEVTDG